MFNSSRSISSNNKGHGNLLVLQPHLGVFPPTNGAFAPKQPSSCPPSGTKLVTAPLHVSSPVKPSSSLSFGNRLIATFSTSDINILNFGCQSPFLFASPIPITLLGLILSVPSFIGQ